MKKFQIFILGILATMFFISCNNAAASSGNEKKQKYSIIVKEGEEVISELFYDYTLTKHFQVEIFSESRVKAGTTVYAWVLAQTPLLGVKADVISEGAVINPNIVAENGADYEEYKYNSVIVRFEMPSNDVTIELSCAPIYKPLNEIKDSEPYYDYVTFGEWPQTKLTDTTVTVDESDSKEAGQFTYYKGSDNAWYAKLNSDYFKVEPIKWYNIPEYYITGTDGSKRFLVSANILLYGYYYDGEQQSNRYRSGPDPNNYEHSRIRALLNGISYNKECTDCDTYLNKGFLFGAFSQAERDLIATTSVVTENPDTTTQDKIFLLSKQELARYNDLVRYYDIDAEKKAPVDYAYYQMSQSTKYEKDGYWWLRSPYEGDDFSAYAVTSSGESEEVYGVRQYPLGIVPVLCLE